jgi:hypothetical protein
MGRFYDRRRLLWQALLRERLSQPIQTLHDRHAAARDLTSQSVWRCLSELR